MDCKETLVNLLLAALLAIVLVAVHRYLCGREQLTFPAFKLPLNQYASPPIYNGKKIWTPADLSKLDLLSRKNFLLILSKDYVEPIYPGKQWWETKTKVFGPFNASLELRWASKSSIPANASMSFDPVPAAPTPVRTVNEEIVYEAPPTAPGTARGNVAYITRTRKRPTRVY